VALLAWPILLAVSGFDMRRGRRLARGVWVAYLSTGAALAIFRVSVLAWIFYRWRESQIIFWFLRPEELLVDYTYIAVIVDFPSMTLRFLFWASLLTVGSFIMATPILLVGWLRQRRPPRWPGIVLPALNLFSAYAALNNDDYRWLWLRPPPVNEPTYWFLGEVLIELVLILSLVGYVGWIVVWAWRPRIRSV